MRRTNDERRSGLRGSVYAHAEDKGGRDAEFVFLTLGHKENLSRRAWMHSSH